MLALGNWFEGGGRVALPAAVFAVLFLGYGVTAILRQVAFLRAAEIAEGVVERVDERVEWERPRSGARQRQVTRFVIGVGFTPTGGTPLHLSYETWGWAGVSVGGRVTVAYLPGAAEGSAQRLDWSRGLWIPAFFGLLGLAAGVVAVKALGG